MTERFKYENDGKIIWFKSNKANGFSWLSNFFPDVSPAAFERLSEEIKSCRGSFVVDGVEFRTVEHFFQSRKYAHMPELAEAIRTTPTAVAAKKKNTEFKHSHPIDVSRWESGKAAEVMEAGLFAKFSQNPPLARALVETGEKDLREVGGRGDDKWAGDRGRTGLLGELLKRVRARLASEGGVPKTTKLTS